MKKLINFAFEDWKWIVGASALLTVICAFFLLRIKIDNSLETLSIEDDPALNLLQQVIKEYGGEEFIVISFKGKDIFSPKVLSMIDRMTTRIEDVKHVERVLSLTNAFTIKGDLTGFGVYPLVPKKSLQLEEEGDLKKKIIANKMYNRMLFSDDGESTSIISWMAPLGKDDAARWEVVNAIQKIINEEKDARKFHLFGIPIYQKAIFDVMLRDQVIFTVILTAFLGVLLLFFFRDIRMVILPFILIGITGLWAIGLLVMSGSTLNYVTFIIPIVVIIVCMCDSVHIMAHYRETDESYADRKDVIKEVITRIGVPIMLTSITTAAGFLSLGISRIKPVRDFGIFTGLGVLFAFAVSVTLLPLIMSILKLKKGKPGKDKSLRIMEEILKGIGNFAHRRRSFILALSIVIVLISLLGVFRIKARQDITAMFKNFPAIEEASKFIDYELGGSCEFNALFESEGENSILEPENLKIIERIQNRLANDELYHRLPNGRWLNLPVARKSISIVDLLKEMNQAINEGDPDYYKIPSTKEQVSQLLLLYSFSEDQVNIKSLVNDDYTQARIRFYTISADDSVLSRKAFNRMEKIVSEEVEGTVLQAAFTGRPLTFLNMVDSLVMGMIKSFSLAFVVILIMMITVFRSLRLGILSMIVNIIPALITFGIMGWLEIPLNMLTAMVPSIAIGIAVDNTIHFMWRMKKEIGVDGDYQASILRSLKSVGKPIMTTSILLCVGFAAFNFSGLVLMTQFGYITIITVFGALVVDLFFAPALLSIFKPFRS